MTDVCSPPGGQVAGRLHVEVVRVGGGLDDSIVGGDETDNNQEAEVQDRKLVCMVRWTAPVVPVPQFKETTHIFA